LATAAAVLAGVARLVPVLRGGGLTGLGNYDDGVYYASGTALLNGILPYRDYVFLHPPGIVVMLAPFGLAGQDTTGLAVARVTWMLLGVINTVLVARILRPVGLVEAAVGALFYATAFPAIYIEWTPMLEGPAQTCVLWAILLLSRAERVGWHRSGCIVLAGALLGLSATFKIWGVVPVATVLVWLLARGRWRPAVQFMVGAFAAVTVICLPFFVAAPSQMWQMVVVDQLGRNRSAASISTRLVDIAAFGLHHGTAASGAAVAATFGLYAALLAVAAGVREARLSVVLTLALTMLLLASPSWFLHYPGLVTGPLAVAVGAGVGTTLRWLGDRRPWAGWAAGIVAAAVLAFAAAPVAGLRLGRTFPSAALTSGSALARFPCVTSDDPTALVALNVLSSNFDHGCRFVADLGGYSYQLATQRGHWTPRARDERWQQIYLAYLASGQASLPFRYAHTGALSPSVETTIASWIVLARSRGYALREPG
jgi:hypothetical protein